MDEERRRELLGHTYAGRAILDAEPAEFGMGFKKLGAMQKKYKRNEDGEFVYAGDGNGVKKKKEPKDPDAPKKLREFKPKKLKPVIKVVKNAGAGTILDSIIPTKGKKKPKTKVETVKQPA